VLRSPDCATEVRNTALFGWSVRGSRGPTSRIFLQRIAVDVEALIDAPLRLTIPPGDGSYDRISVPPDAKDIRIRVLLTIEGKKRQAAIASHLEKICRALNAAPVTLARKPATRAAKLHCAWVGAEIVNVAIVHTPGGGWQRERAIT
jgi:hypothetical protein